MPCSYSRTQIMTCMGRPTSEAKHLTHSTIDQGISSAACPLTGLVQKSTAASDALNPYENDLV